jgi:hypothetical protein
MSEPIWGLDVDGMPIELCFVSVPLTPESTIKVLVTKAEANAGWGLTDPRVYDVWQPDHEPDTYKPWAKWRVTETGEVVALLIPETDTAIPYEDHHPYLPCN